MKTAPLRTVTGDPVSLRPRVAAAASRPTAGRHRGFAESFAQIVAVLMRDRNFRTLTLADLEWLVLPPVIAGQFALAHASMQPSSAKSNNGTNNSNNGATNGAKTQDGHILVPVAVALWARVTANLDKALSENLDKPLRLNAGDWVSGDNLWLIALAGDRRAVPKFLDRLSEKDFKGRQLKMRVRGPDGKAVIKTLGQTA
jgi:cytolysin-activating lysine-acyltransferase